MNYKSNLIQQFSERGYIHQATDIEALDALAVNHTIPTYIGFDCTADSLHVGSLVQIMMPVSYTHLTLPTKRIV